MSIKTKDELRAAADVIAQASTAGSNTRQRVADILTDIVDSTGAGAGVGSDTKHWYVNPNTGLDANAGTELAPFLTLDKAIIAAREWPGKSVIHLFGHVDDEPYESEEFWNPLPDDIEFIGEGVRVVSGPHAITGFPSNQFALDGVAFDVDQWTGHTCEVYESVNQSMIQVVNSSGSLVGDIDTREGSRRHICDNTTTALRLAYYHEAYPGFTPRLSVGDRLRIVRPAVSISLAPREDGAPRTLHGGKSNSMNIHEERPRSGMLKLRNIELRYPDGQNHTVFATGAFDLVGVSVTSDQSGGAGIEFVEGGFLVFENASVIAGQWVRSDFSPDEYVYGWGLALYSRDPAKVGPRLWLGKTLSDMYLVSTGAVSVGEGGWLEHQAGYIAAGVRNEALTVYGGGTYNGGGDGAGPLIFNAPEATKCNFDAYNGGTIHLGAFIHKGDGAVVRLGQTAGLGRAGSISLGGAITIEGSTPLLASGNSNLVARGGRVEIANVALANLGDLRVGLGSAQQERVSGAWSVDEAVVDGRGSVVERNA